MFKHLQQIKISIKALQWKLTLIPRFEVLVSVMTLRVSFEPDVETMNRIPRAVISGGYKATSWRGTLVEKHRIATEEP